MIAILKQPIAQIIVRQDTVKLNLVPTAQISNFEQRRAAIKIDGNVIVKNFYGTTAIGAVSGEPSISALRCIVMRSGLAYVASSDDVSCANVIAGISTTAASKQGDSLVVQGSGVIEDSSFAWEDDKPIFCGPDGRLTQTPPTSGFWQIVGTPISATKFEINIQIAINF